MMNRPLPLLFFAVCVAPRRRLLPDAAALRGPPVVLDGETIVVSLADGSERQVRLLGIAAPSSLEAARPGNAAGSRPPTSSAPGSRASMSSWWPIPVAYQLDGYGPLPPATSTTAAASSTPSSCGRVTSSPSPTSATPAGKSSWSSSGRLAWPAAASGPRGAPALPRAGRPARCSSDLDVTPAHRCRGKYSLIRHTAIASPGSGLASGGS